MKSILIVLTVLILLLFSCARVTLLKDGNGNDFFLVECQGSGNSWSTCYQKALDICPNGYDLVEQAQASGGGMIVGN